MRQVNIPNNDLKFLCARQITWEDVKWGEKMNKNKSVHRIDM